ncbi:putative relaxin receptor 2-like [Apostichopus japonicus]|uniref:Putative relaxin receptor 2-like n=1 Tax=Stichopus japonicus TaxID=307972 RepID=A0A2G8JVY4_STIJA|nr:putative relaxin receptor 2-like [Apostichopus japonicus]
MYRLLDQNLIHTIEPGSFSKLFKLQHITMSNNMLTHLTVGMFDGLSQVSSLSLYANKITEMENGTFEPLIKVSSLNLKDNLFRVVPRGIFDVMPMLGHIYFDHFFLCGFAPHVKDCDPKSDGLSTSEDLLGSIVLRVAVWLVSILASFGNLIVLFARCVSKEDNKVHSFFIINLAISDFLMGAYLFIVAVHDVMYRGVYILHDVDWRSSWVCQLCGAFSLLSSEMSVFTLTIITADRYFCIVHPFRFRSRNLIPAAILMGCLWIIGITLSILPLLHRSYFGDFFYGANGVCLPLQFDRPFDDGWLFSLFVFVVANLLSFTFIVWAYIRMFFTIRRSNLAARSTKVSQDYALLKRFTVIVATDFLCWMPIIIVKFVTYGGVAIPPAAHAWFAIFILPVNSALNPILYTMTTRQFKRMIFHPSRTFMGKQKSTAGHEMSQSMSRTRDREIGHTATSRLSVISHSNTMKNGTPTTPRNGHMENLSHEDNTNNEDRDQNMDSPE